MTKKELIQLLEPFNDDDKIVIDIGRYSKSNWKYAEDVDYDHVNAQNDTERVITIR